MARYTIDNLPAPVDFSAGTDWVERTVRNCKNLLMLRKGELPYDRQRGLDPALFDLGIDEMNDVLLQEVDRALLWEPDAEAVSAEAEMLPNTAVVIRVVIEIDEEE